MYSLFWMRCRAMIFALSVVMLIAGEGTSVAQTVNPSSGLTYLTDDVDWDKLPPDPEPVFEPPSEPEREETSNTPAQWFLGTRAGGILGFQINGDDHDGRFGFDFEILLRLSNSLALKGALLGTPSTITSQIGIGADNERGVNRNGKFQRYSIGQKESDTASKIKDNAAAAIADCAIVFFVINQIPSSLQ